MKRDLFVALVLLFGVVAQAFGAERDEMTYRADNENVRWVGRVDVAPEGEVRVD
jgi:hypothetical protein